MLHMLQLFLLLLFFGFLKGIVTWGGKKSFYFEFASTLFSYDLILVVIQSYGAAFSSFSENCFR